MVEIPQWFSITIASIIPALGVVGFWMTISARLSRAETTSEMAKDHSIKAGESLVMLTKNYTDFREQVAREYIHRSTMIEVEDRLSQSIDRLGDRFDRFLTKVIDPKGIIP